MEEQHVVNVKAVEAQRAAERASFEAEKQALRKEVEALKTAQGVGKPSVCASVPTTSDVTAGGIQSTRGEGITSSIFDAALTTDDVNGAVTTTTSPTLQASASPIIDAALMSDITSREGVTTTPSAQASTSSIEAAPTSGSTTITPPLADKSLVLAAGSSLSGGVWFVCRVLLGLFIVLLGFFVVVGPLNADQTYK